MVFLFLISLLGSVEDEINFEDFVSIPLMDLAYFDHLFAVFVDLLLIYLFPVYFGKFLVNIVNLIRIYPLYLHEALDFSLSFLEFFIIGSDTGVDVQSFAASRIVQTKHGMVKSFGPAHSPFDVYLEGSVQEVFHFPRSSFGVLQLVPVLPDILDQVFFVVAVERIFPCQHCEKQAPNAPNIDFRGLTFLEHRINDLGR